MSVDSKTVLGRRDLNFNSLDDVVADAKWLVGSPGTKLLGNWPLNKLLCHLATAINGSIDGVTVKAPLIARIIGPFVKKRVLRNKMPSGFKLPKHLEADFFPNAASNEAAFEILRSAVARLKTERMTSRHPVFGKLTHDEWNKLHLRHSELHLSFAIPE